MWIRAQSCATRVGLEISAFLAIIPVSLLWCLTSTLCTLSAMQCPDLVWRRGPSRLPNGSSRLADLPVTPTSEYLPHALPNTIAKVTYQLPSILSSSYEVDGLLQGLLYHGIRCGDRVGCTSRTRLESSLHHMRLYPGFRALLAAEDHLL